MDQFAEHQAVLVEFETMPMDGTPFVGDLEHCAIEPARSL